MYYRCLGERICRGAGLSFGGCTSGSGACCSLLTTDATRSRFARQAVFLTCLCAGFG